MHVSIGVGVKEPQQSCTVHVGSSSLPSFGTLGSLMYAEVLAGISSVLVQLTTNKKRVLKPLSANTNFLACSVL